MRTIFNIQAEIANEAKKQLSRFETSFQKNWFLFHCFEKALKNLVLSFTRKEEKSNNRFETVDSLPISALKPPVILVAPYVEKKF